MEVIFLFACFVFRVTPRGVQRVLLALCLESLPVVFRGWYNSLVHTYDFHIQSLCWDYWVFLFCLRKYLYPWNQGRKTWAWTAAALLVIAPPKELFLLGTLCSALSAKVLAFGCWSGLVCHSHWPLNVRQLFLVHHSGLGGNSSSWIVVR